MAATLPSIPVLDSTSFSGQRCAAAARASEQHAHATQRWLVIAKSGEAGSRASGEHPDWLLGWGRKTLVTGVLRILSF